MSIAGPLLENLVLITGGARSGKSTLAEKLAGERSSNVVYLATMPRIEEDEELEAKIHAHKSRRPSSWRTVEETLEIADVIENLTNSDSACLIDCLSAYVSNIMYHLEQKTDLAKDAKQVETLKEVMQSGLNKLLESIERKNKILFIIVTNEVGWSIVPENKNARIFRELLGAANQTLARSADSMYLCCSGITIRVKTAGKELLS